ncbi:MAG: inverse autotransporter beta domain-containing protein [Candidatus Pelagibacter sp.]
MKRILITLITFFVITSSNADDLSNKISNIIADLIPGEGDTEVSIDLRENHKPDYSILGVREIDKTDSGNFFTQFSLSNTEKRNTERTVGNLGFGQRMLSNDNTMMTGYNVFWDYDSYGNSRTSLGLEARNAVLDFSGNYYLVTGDGKDEEKPLEGYDLNLASQVPYMHWADVFVNAYEWFGRDRAGIRGTKLGSELLLNPNLNLELAFDDKDKKGLEDEWYARVMFVYPPRSGPSLQDGFISATAWNEEKDMSKELLTKVKRNNKIVVEFKGTSTISRTD